MTPRLESDEPELARRLDGLSVRARAAFAASCAQRTIRWYQAFHRETGRGSLADVEAGLEAVWAFAAGAEVDFGDHERRCMEAVPDEEAGPHPTDWLASDSGAAVTYAVRCAASGGVQEAVWAARRSLEGAWLEAQVAVEGDQRPTADDPDESHPTIQRELRAQQAGLELLESEDLSASLLARLRSVDD